MPPRYRPASEPRPQTGQNAGIRSGSQERKQVSRKPRKPSLAYKPKYGLIPVMALAQRAGLADLVGEHLRPGGGVLRGESGVARSGDDEVRLLRDGEAIGFQRQNRRHNGVGCSDEVDAVRAQVQRGEADPGCWAATCRALDVGVALMLELEVEAHIVHLLEDVVSLGVGFDWQTAASTGGKSLGPSVTNASHRAMLMRAVCGVLQSHALAAGRSTRGPGAAWAVPALGYWLS